MLAVQDEVPAVESLDHEVKFVLPAGATAPARILLEGLCRRETPHARSRIGTIYFDDRALSSAGEKLASDYRKTKIRLRWYDGAGSVRLEVKRRVGSRREKLRRELPGDAAALEVGGLAAAERTGYRDALRALGVTPPADLAPVLHLTYERERFVDPASGARLSLDSRIEAVERAPWSDTEALRCEASDDLDVALIESKGGWRDLPPALLALAALGARRRSYSKYTACLLHRIG